MHYDDHRPVTILRCDVCGDTFPTEDPEGVRCPSCGSEAVHPASEPLL